MGSSLVRSHVHDFVTLERKMEHLTALQRGTVSWIVVAAVVAAVAGGIVAAVAAGRQCEQAWVQRWTH